jgi:hypothetical protein
MTIAAPLFLWIAAGAAAVTIALHLLAWRRPPESPLPTARFAPERPIRMVSRAVRPADLALLALRVLLVLLVGVALAGPSLRVRRQGVGRVVVVDRSRSAGPGADVTSAARAAVRPGDAVVVFDSTAREIASPSADSLGAPEASRARGSVSTAMIAAVRAARRLERERDSVEIVVISPFTSDELDAATGAIRATWPGPVRLVRARAAPNAPESPGRATVRGADGDAVAVALGFVAPFAGGESVQVVRGALTAADSAWARDGRAVVVWPDALVPDWRRRAAADTAFAVTAPAGGGTDRGGARPATVIAPFVRTLVPPPGRVIARWSDGEPAVTEVALGTGCLRSVAVPVPAVGDLPLTPAFRRFAERMVETCEGTSHQPAVPDSVLGAVLPARVPTRDRLTVAALGAETPPSRLAAWMLALALVAAVAELWVRRGASDATA